MKTTSTYPNIVLGDDESASFGEVAVTIALLVLPFVLLLVPIAV